MVRRKHFYRKLRKLRVTHVEVSSGRSNQEYGCWGQAGPGENPDSAGSQT